jgi:Tol biopolymer transport system component
MRACVLALVAVVSLAVPAIGARSDSERAPKLVFKLVNMKGERRVVSRHAINPYAYSLSPNHKELVYIPNAHTGQPLEPTMVAAVRGAGERILAGPSLDLAWAPDGRTIALQTEGSYYGLNFVNPDGSDLRHVANTAELVWSPDSKSLASKRGIRVLSLETGEERFLSGGHSPTWSPHGKRIAFVHNTPGYYGIAVVSLRTGAIRELTRGNSPAWSPDGSRIAFIRYVRDAYHPTLWVISTRGGRPRRVARGFVWPPEPGIWSPKGRYIAYAKRGGLFVVNREGYRSRLLAHETGEIRLLAWSRDGRHLLYFTLSR